MAAPRHVTLDELTIQYQALRDTARRLGDGLDPVRALQRPKPGSWSLAECLRHLEITAEQYRPAIQQAIERAIGAGRADGPASDGTFALSWLARRMITSIEPPPRMRLKAPRAFLPKPEPNSSMPQLDWPQTAEDYDAAKVRYLDLLDQAKDLDFTCMRITSPVSRLIKMRVDTAFAFLAAHDRRHLWQAERAVEAVKRPS